MASSYRVVKARNAGEKDNPHGGKLVKWYLTVADTQGQETEDVYCQKKPENPLNVGDEVFGRLEQGEYGWRLFPEQSPNGSGGSGGGGGNWKPRPPEEIAGMRHAHNLTVAAASLTPLPLDASDEQVHERLRLLDRMAKGLDAATSRVAQEAAGA